MKKTLLIIVGLIISINSFSQKKFAKKDLIADIDFLVHKYEKIHPNLYAFQSEDVFKNEIQNLKKELNDSLTSFELWLKLCPIINSLKHGHTDLGVNQEDAQIVFKDFVDEGYKFLPFSVYMIDSNVYVQEVYIDSSNLKPGDKILTINGNKIEEIISKLLGYQSGERYNYRLNNVERTFIWDYSLYYPSTSFDIEYSSNNGLKTSSLKGINYEDTEIYSSKVFKELPKYKFEIIKDSIGLISFNSCIGINDEDFNDFLNNTFDLIHKNNLNNVILDLRQNGGGDNSFCFLLFNRFFDKSYHSHKKIEVKVTEDIRNFKEFYNQFKSDTVIRFDTFHENSMDNNKRFKNNLFVLISVNTFSSGADCAMIFKDYDVGILIGQETGGLSSGYGDVYRFSLPHSGLNANVSFKTFLRPSGINNGMGVIPDVAIKYSITDLINKKDLEMDYVLKQINGE